MALQNMGNNAPCSPCLLAKEQLSVNPFSVHRGAISTCCLPAHIPRTTYVSPKPAQGTDPQCLYSMQVEMAAGCPGHSSIRLPSTCLHVGLSPTTYCRVCSLRAGQKTNYPSLGVMAPPVWSDGVLLSSKVRKVINLI